MSDVMVCPHCDADFSSDDAWKPTVSPGKPPLTGPGLALRVVARLILGAVCSFAALIFTMLAGFFGGASIFPALTYLLALATLTWALLPIFQRHAQRNDA